MMRNKRPTTCSGFTLLELLIAIALMGMIAVTLYASMNIAFKAKQRGQASLEPYQRVVPIFEVIRRDLTSAMRPAGILAGIFEGQDVPYSNTQDADTISFYTAGYQPKEDETVSNVINVQYALEVDHDRDLVVFKRLVTRNLLAPTAADPDEEIIARDIAGLDIEYYDGETWLTGWDSSEQDAMLPWGVKVTIAILDENRSRFSRNDDPYRYFTRIFVLPFAGEAETASEEETG